MKESTMRKPRSFYFLALATSTVVLAVGCADITSPAITTLTDSGNATMSFSKHDPGSDDNSYAHAIHVRIRAMPFNSTDVDEYSFHAVRHGDDVKGNFQFFQLRTIGGVEETVVIASGFITCLTVAENRARVGGRVEATTFPEGIPIGSEITWSVTDNGKSAKADDSASQPLGNNARAYCLGGLPYPEHPVERGKIQVWD